MAKPESFIPAALLTEPLPVSKWCLAGNRRYDWGESFYVIEEGLFPADRGIDVRWRH
jgi:hypothetical protein